MITVEQIAMVAHEVNRSYCQSIGDNSQPSWTDAPEWQKSSAINGVKMHINNPDATPEQSHESWMKQKQEEGWKYGPVKDAEKKEHPCFLPYAELPENQKAKDYIFRGVVHSMAPMLSHAERYMAKDLGRTEGVKIVGLDFNPSKSPEVDYLKRLHAEAIDVVMQRSSRFSQIAADQALLSQMSCVKAVTNPQHN